MIIHLKEITFSADQLRVNFLYVLSDKSYISLVVLFPVECYAIQFKQVLGWVFQRFHILFQTFITERATFTANATWAAYVIADTIVADLLLNRVLRMDGGGK
ncbi:hypothetical protein ASE98_04240 [Pseudomonas sp. Leaf48]|nr:hypothetical protein ASE98_04240 [Pseudomonas sp. Leaf48]